nr:alanine racemase [uncultured Ralstonia sp.]
MNALGVKFRPHVKTTKCLDVVRAQAAAGAQGITVSTLKEAEAFFAAGIKDILYAVGIVAAKLPRAMALRRRGCDLKLVVDNVAAAQAVVDYVHAHGERCAVWIEVDTDGHRSGITPEQDALLEVGRILKDGRIDVGGVMTHAGSSYDLNDHTALATEQLEGVTEVRAGVYVFFDLVMHNVGVCAMDEIALSALITVIGHQPDKGWVIVDAGWMAMSRDRGTAKQAHDYGYGQPCALDGTPFDGLMLIGANQEHGILAASDGSVRNDLAERFPVGTKLRILPKHACVTGAQFPEYQAVSSRGAVQTWGRFHGW